MKMIKYTKLIWLFLLLAWLAPPVNCPAAASQAILAPHEQPLPLLPFLNYILDTSLDMNIEEASRATGWQPFIPDKLPMKEGVLWLRFEIAPHAPDARPRTYLLDMGQSVPGTPILFDPINNELSGAREWRESVPESRNILLLPEASSEAITCYIRMDGLPGPWFAPMIRTPRNAASDWASLSHTAAVLALAMVMLLCLLRGVSERGQWRYWTALFVAVALLQALLGLPTVNDSFNLAEVAAVMSPGLALMLMPHACRHLMYARKYSRAIDIQLFLLAFPGAILAVLPLVPGWIWLYRWLDLWPLATVIFIPTALGAWMLSIPGARRFLLACIIPPIFTACALLGVDFGLPANVLASGPTWGVVLASLLLGTTKAPVQPEEEEAPKQGTADKTEKPALPLLDIEPEQEEIITLEHPLDDPNLRLIPSSRATQVEASPPEMPVPQSEPTSAPVATASGAEEWESALRKPLDDLVREGAALLRCSLPASARQYAENMIESAHHIANIVSKPELLMEKSAPEEGEESFNLQRILRNAHDSVAASAEASGIALSWYTPPHLGQLYHGDARGLESTLSMLLESSVRSSHHGAIKVSAKRVPDSPDPGHLLFTITDDGNGYPPLERSSLALVHAWELAGRYNGYLSVESSQHGATIAFTAHFEPLGENKPHFAEQDLPHVILIGEDAEARRQLARIIETLPCILTETDAPPEAISNQVQKPATLVITQGRFARPAAADLIRQLVRLAREAGIKCHALAVTADENEWPLLKASGFTHAMLSPVDPEILRRIVKELTEPKNEKEADYEEGEQLPAATEDKAPSMLIEQILPLPPVFEGPDWLGEPEEDNSEQGEIQAAPPESTPEPEASLEPEPSQDTESQTAQKDAQAEPGAPSEAIEWVGEPMPVPSPVEQEQKNESPSSDADVAQGAGSVPEPVRSAPETGFQAPEDAVDWVGEPTPIVKEEPPKEPQEKKRELLDFIVGVNQKPDQANKPVSPVRSFVESSVNMVTSTISSILRQKGKQEMPTLADTTPDAPEDDIKARSDPAIIALLERLDASMRHANAAFAARNAPAVAESTGLIAGDAEKFGLRQLARMARCIERAALANNMAALSDLLPELGIAVERNKITLAERKGAES